MTYQTKKCPHCKMVYERNTYAGSPSKANRTKYGSPVKVCVRCKKTFVDKEYREIAVEGIREVDNARVSPGTIVYSLIGFFMGIGAFTNVNRIAGVVILGFVVWMFLDEWKGYDKRQENLAIDRRASEKRLSNPAYAALLKELGYDVPEKYLCSQNSMAETSALEGE